MKKVLQKVVLPTNERHQAAWELFYRGPRFVNIADENALLIGAGNVADFTTYVNGFPIKKWKKYTNMKSVCVNIQIEGKAKIAFVGYKLEPSNPVRHEFDFVEIDSEGISNVEFAFPEEDVQELYGFEIQALETTKMISAQYEGDYDEDDMRDVTLSIATTTFKNENFIINNVKALKNELLSESSDIKDDLYIHVTDNGRTLSPDQIVADHIYLHANNNTGGSGGFARGMMESLHQDPKPTHVLLMDDDVLILPESIRRTYQLLTVVKDEYSEAFVSGAMLDYEKMFFQIEDIGKVDPQLLQCESLKGTKNQFKLKNILRTNREVAETPYTYQAWWYCCIPVTVIEKNGLPLPLFIRQDDVEYGLRCKPQILSMTGICVWHMGFGSKYSASMLMYQEFRNKLVGNAITGAFEGLDIYDRWKKVFRTRMLAFSYNEAELLLMAMEDYLKGPTFIKQDLGEKIIKANSKFNDKLSPLSDFPQCDVKSQKKTYKFEKRGLLEKIIYRATYNGHRFIPTSWLSKNTNYIGYDAAYQPKRWSLHRDVLLVNIHNRTACLHTIDKARYKELIKRYKKVLDAYNKTHTNVEAAYRAEKDYITSEDFWNEYLRLNK